MEGKKSIIKKNGKRKVLFKMKRKKKVSHTIGSYQFLIYVIGLLVMALGITLNTKTGLGVSPIISIPYNISILGKWNLGLVTFLFYSFLVLLQFLLLGKNFQPSQWLQIPMSLITSLFIDLFDIVLPDIQQTVFRFLFLFVAILFTGIGASLTVGMKLVPNPADGLANVLGLLAQKGFGFGKNLFDFSCLFLSACIGILFAGHLIGIGIGTIFTMLFTGRVVALCQKNVTLLYQTFVPVS